MRKCAVGILDSLSLLRKIKRGDLSALLDITNEFDIVMLNLPGQKVVIPSSVDLLYDFFKADQKGLVKTPRAQHYTRKAMGVGLISTDKEEWREKRNACRGIFNTAELNGFTSTMDDAIHFLFSSGRVNAQLDVVMASITINVIGRLFFGDFSDEDAEKIRISVTKMMEPTFRRMISPVPFLVDPLNIRTSFYRKQMFDVLSANIISARRSPKPNLIRKYFAENDCVEDVANLFAAGYETTASATVWLLYELSRNEGIKRRMREELSSIESLEDYHKLQMQIPLTIACVKEILRLYPPAWILGRTSTEDILIGDMKIDSNTDVVLSPFVFHRSSKYWDKPDLFDPYRFFNDKALEHKYYFPFGIGIRSCIGEKLALLEIYHILFYLFNNFEFEIDSKKVAMNPHFTLKPAGSIHIQLKPKKNEQQITGTGTIRRPTLERDLSK
ncbi:MAG: cytochrome P450 [Chitinophagales bacterium]|nr:cytochrome P450 [Chitinophagales bacterium]